MPHKISVESMEPVVELTELMERIRQAANRENGLPGATSREISATTELPPVPEPLPLPPSPFTTATSAGAKSRPEILLDQAASMLLGGRQKNTVPASVPRLLRGLFRNQGGFNAVVLEAVERLVEVNRDLRQQNYELHERLMDFYSWTHTVTQASVENRDWMSVADARLRAVPEERLVQLEARLARLEGQSGPDEDAPPGNKDDAA